MLRGSVVQKLEKPMEDGLLTTGVQWPGLRVTLTGKKMRTQASKVFKEEFLRQKDQ